MNLKEILGDISSASAFKTIDGEKRIIGKWGQISLIDDTFDVWLIQPDLSSLTERRITTIENKLQLNGTLIKLTGEAYFQTKDIDLIRRSIPVLGIRKKKQLSEATKEKLRQQLRKK